MRKTEVKAKSQWQKKSDSIQEKFYDELVSHLGISPDGEKTSAELIQAALDAPPRFWKRSFTPEKLQQAAHEVMTTFVKGCDLSDLERLAKGLIAVSDSTSLEPVMEKISTERKRIAMWARERCPFLARPEWLYASLSRGLHGALISRSEGNSVIPMICELVHKSKGGDALSPEMLRSAIKNFEEKIRGKDASHFLSQSLNRILQGTVENPEFAETIRRLYPATALLHTCLGSSLLSSDVSLSAHACIDTLYTNKFHSSLRAKRIERAKELLQEKLTSDDAAAVLERFFQKVICRIERSTDVAERLCKRFESLSKRTYFKFPGVDDSKEKFHALQRLLVTQIPTAFAEVIFPQPTATHLDLFARKDPHEKSRFADFFGSSGNVSSTSIVFKRIRGSDTDSDLKKARRKSSESKEEDLRVISSSNRRFNADTVDWYQLTRKVAARQLVEAICAIAQSLERLERSHARGKKQQQKELDDRLIRTSRLLELVLHPSVDEALKIILNQRQLIHHMELRPHSELQIRDRLKMNDSQKPSKVAIDVENSEQRGLIRNTRRKISLEPSLN